MIVTDGAELQGGLKAADHKCGPRPRQWPYLGTDCRFFLQFSVSLAPAAGLMVPAPPLVATQPLFDAERRLVGTLVSVGSHAFRFE